MRIKSRLKSKLIFNITKESVLLTLMLVVLMSLILYEIGVFRLEFSNQLFADDDGKWFTLKKGEEKVVITSGTKINVGWDPGSGIVQHSGSVTFSLLNIMMKQIEVQQKVKNTKIKMSIPIDDIRNITIFEKGNRAWKMAKYGGLVGTVAGTIIFTSAGVDGGVSIIGGAICFGVPSALIGGIGGGIAGAGMKNSITYPIGTNEWEITIE